MRLKSYNNGTNSGFSKVATTIETGNIVTVSEAKDFCRITTSDDDTLIQLLIDSAEEMVVNFTSRTLRETSYTYEYKTFAKEITLPYAPHKSVSEVRSKLNGVETVLDSDSYYLSGQEDKTLNIISPIYGGLEIDLVAGYGVANVPKTIKLAILKTVLTNYENRQDDSMDNTYELANDTKALLKPYRKVFI